MSEWKEYYLTEVGELGRGKSKHRPRWAPELYGGDYPFIQTGEITSAQKYISSYSNTYSEKGLAQSKLWPKDTLCITIAANIAELAILKFPACFPDSVLGFTPDSKKVDLDFVYYTLVLFQKRLKQLAIGSVQDNINLGTFLNIKFPFPELSEQKEIAKTLSSLDSKISLLRQQNETLEELAQTLFKRWFVDFEFPDENGQPYKSSGGKMIDSDLGEIPEGWRIGMLGNFTVLKSGYAFKSVDFIDLNSIKAIKIKDLQGKGVVDITDCSSIESNLTTLDRVKFFKLSEGDIVLAMSGNTTGKIGVIPPHENELYLNQRVGKFFLRDSTFTSFLYNFLMSGNYEERILSMGYGSAQPNINPTQIESIEMLIPKSNILSNYIKISNPIYKEVLSNNSQIQSLTELRDTLLPKLMSGELTINEL